MKVSLLMTTLLLLSAQAFAYDAAKVFKTNCATSHLIGGGDKTGPDLAGVGKRRSIEWLVKFINYPEGMINGDSDEEDYGEKKGKLNGKAITYGDKVAYSLYETYKPNMMAEQEMSKEEVQAMIKYIDSVSKTPKGKITTFKVLDIK
jgi:mono/diheme cytochrome c family protein